MAVTQQRATELAIKKKSHKHLTVSKSSHSKKKSMERDQLQDSASAPPPSEQPAGDGETAVVLSASSEHACYTSRSEQLCWAITHMKAPFYEPTSRAPVDIVAVIDKSGSMAGQKISLVRDTLLFVIDQCELVEPRPHTMHCN